MPYKLIASDLDGTLVDSNSDISTLNIKAIGDAVNAGVYFAICSGRSPHSLKKFNKIIGLDKPGCYGIGFNGGIVYRADTMEILYEHRLNKDAVIKTVAFIKEKYPDAPLMAYMEQNLIYYDCGDDSVNTYAAHSGIHLEKVGSLKDAVDRDVMKLIIRWEPEKLAVLMDDIRYRVQPHCDMFLSANNFLEFAPLGSNKATGLKVLSDYLGLDMNEVVAVGDNFNDMDMIMAAGLGIAVNNAVEEVKAIADYITQADNDNNAIKEVVEMVLKEYK